MANKKISKYSTKTEGLLNYSDLKKVHYKLVYGFMVLFLTVVALACIIPFVWVFVSGFKSVEEMYATDATFFPKVFHFENLVNVITKVQFGSYLKNTLILVVGCLFCDILFNGLAGYVLSRLKPAGTKIMAKIVFISMMLPGISMVPLYMSFVDVPFLHVNLIGTYMPIWIMSAAVPFDIMLFRDYFNGLSMSYFEAGRLDGATDFQMFTKIVIPLSVPIIMTVAIFTVTGTWGNFLWPYLILGGTAKEPISVMIYKLSSATTLMQNEYMLLLMITVLPLIVIFIFFSKYIMGGVNVGGVKE